MLVDQFSPPDGLECRDGVWFTKTSSENALSYPSEGNDECFRVEDSSYWFGHRNACIVELVRQFPPNGLIFDIGGGNGFVAKGLEEAGFATVVIEPGPGATHAAQRGLRNVICGSIEAAGFRSGSLSAAGMFDVIEHIADSTDFLRMLRQLMPPKARLYVSVPALRILWSAEDDRAGHYRRYTIASVSRELTKIGFDVEFATYFFSFLPIPIFLARSLPSLLGIRNTSAEVIEREHKEPSGLIGRIMRQTFSWERSRIAAQRPLPIVGSSCLAVASSA